MTTLAEILSAVVARHHPTISMKVTPNLPATLASASLKPERLETGTGPLRRRLTLAEAERGALPTPFTKGEWNRLRDESVLAARDAQYRDHTYTPSKE
jgi:hypothetical protein